MKLFFLAPLFLFAFNLSASANNNVQTLPDHSIARCALHNTYDARQITFSELDQETAKRILNDIQYSISSNEKGAISSSDIVLQPYSKWVLFESDEGYSVSATATVPSIFGNEILQTYALFRKSSTVPDISVQEKVHMTYSEVIKGKNSTNVYFQKVCTGNYFITRRNLDPSIPQHQQEKYQQALRKQHVVFSTKTDKNKSTDDAESLRKAIKILKSTGVF